MTIRASLTKVKTSPRMIATLLFSLFLTPPSLVHEEPIADTPLFHTYGKGCAWGAKDKDTYTVINTGYGAQILFEGGYSSDFIIAVDGWVYYDVLDEVYFLKDDFCDYESNVLVINGEVLGVNEVSEL